MTSVSGLLSPIFPVQFLCYPHATAFGSCSTSLTMIPHSDQIHLSLNHTVEHANLIQCCWSFSGLTARISSILRSGAARGAWSNAKRTLLRKTRIWRLLISLLAQEPTSIAGSFPPKFSTWNEIRDWSHGIVNFQNVGQNFGAEHELPRADSDGMQKFLQLRLLSPAHKRWCAKPASTFSSIAF